MSATNTFANIVSDVNAAPVLAAMSNRTVNPGQTISSTAIKGVTMYRGRAD